MNITNNSFINFIRQDASREGMPFSIRHLSGVFVEQHDAMRGWEHGVLTL